GDRHAQDRRHSRRRVSCAKGVILAFTSFRETGNTTEHPVGVEFVTASGEYLVAIGLVAYIPYQQVTRRIVHVMKRHGKFHHPQARAQMSTINRNIVDDEISKLAAQLDQLSVVQFFEVIRVVYGSQKFSGPYQHFSGSKFDLSTIKVTYLSRFSDQILQI